MSDVQPQPATMEFLVEPFVINEPGRHVVAAVDVVRAAGLQPDMGPFATTAGGDLDTILDAASTMLRAAFAEGATSIQLRIGHTNAE